MTLVARLRQTVAKALPIGLGMVMLFAGQVVLARLVGAAVFGSYGYMLTWVTIAALLAKAGHDFAVMKTLPVLRRNREYGRISFLLRRTAKVVTLDALWMALALVGAALVATWLGRVTLSPTTYIVGVGLLFVLAWSALRRATMLSAGMTWASEGPENMVKPALICGFVWLLIIVGGEPTPERVLALTLAATGIVLALASVVAYLSVPAALRRIAPEPFDLADVKSVAKSMRLTNLVAVVLRNSDILIVGSMVSAAATGIYIAASRVAAIAGVIVTILDPVASPRVSAAYAEGNRRELRAIALEYSAISSAGSLTFVLAMVIGGDFILGLFGTQFTQGTAIALVLLLGHLANALTGPSGVFLSMTGGEKISFRVSFWAAAFYLLLLAILVPLMSAMGAAIAFAISTATKNVVQCVYVWRMVGINTTLLPFSPAQDPRS
jgi:O-antigen/teichoic acid export membrane protein